MGRNHITAMSVCLAVGGCLFPSLNEFGGAAVDAGVDATSDASDSSVIDSASDRSVVPESGTDAPVDVSPCTEPHIFCDDFDSTSGDPFGFQSSYGGGVAKGLLTTADFVSKPNAFLLTTPMTSSPGGAQYALKNVNSGTFATATLEFDVRIDLASFSGLGAADSVLFRFGVSNVDSLSLSWIVSSSETRVGQDVKQATVPLAGQDVHLPAQPLKQWTHVSMSVTLGSPPLLTVKYDGAQVFSGALHFQAEQYPLKFGPDVEVNVGIFYLESGSAPWRLEFDNVIVK